MYARFHDNPPNSCLEISLKSTANVNMLVVQEEMLRDQQSQ